MLHAVMHWGVDAILDGITDCIRDVGPTLPPNDLVNPKSPHSCIGETTPSEIYL
jgi:hypothetical protein